MTFITLTDGSGNHVNTDIHNGEKKDWDKTTVFGNDNKKFTTRYNITESLLTHIKKYHNVNVIGFYIVKRVRRWDIERYVKNYSIIEMKKNYSNGYEKAND